MRIVPITFCVGSYRGRPERSNFFVYATLAPRALIIFARAACMSRPSVDSPSSCAMAAEVSANAAMAARTFALITVSSLQFRKLSARDLGRKRQVLSILLDKFLSLARKHETDE